MEGMSAHLLEVIALGNKVGLEGGLVYKGGDVSGNNMKAGADKTQQGGIGTAMGDNAVGSFRAIALEAARRE
jgi:hypothetical protein